MPASHTDPPDQVSFTAEIVAAYVSHNSVPSGDLARLMQRFGGSAVVGGVLG